MSNQASVLSTQKAIIIRCNVLCLYQQNEHRLLKKIMGHSDILTKNENVEFVVYRDSIPYINFKLLFKSIISNY